MDYKWILEGNIVTRLRQYMVYLAVTSIRLMTHPLSEVTLTEHNLRHVRDKVANHHQMETPAKAGVRNMKNSDCDQYKI